MELAITVLINEGSHQPSRTFFLLSLDGSSLVFFLSAGDNILVPCPGFPLYQVITESLGGHVKHYALQVAPLSLSLSHAISPSPQPEKEWECDLEDMDRLVDENTKAILITNPSNPCGSSYSREHLTAIVEIARLTSPPPFLLMSQQKASVADHCR